MRILVVEDEARMAALLSKALTEEGHSVSVARTGLEGLGLADDGALDAIVLDLTLPELDGLEVLRRLRAGGSRTPVLVLTARDAVPDIVKGLDVGADDYLTKPFSLEVLLARVRAVGRRGPIAQPVVLRVANLTLDPSTRRAYRANEPIALSRTEYTLLECLMRRAGTVVPRQTLFAAVWGHGRDVEENTLDAFIRLLRHKVDGEHEPKLIHTVRGIGYMVGKEPQA